MPARFFLSLPLLSLILGCEPETDSRQHQETAPRPEDETIVPVKPVPEALRQGLPDEDVSDMLTLADPTRPEVWLAAVYRRRHGSDHPGGVAYYRQLLNGIQPHVHETRRMIANRSVQTSQNLADDGLDASTESILEGFAEQLEDSSGQYVYGELCAHYGNLRLQGLAHQEAINTLFRALE